MQFTTKTHKGLMVAFGLADKVRFNNGVAVAEGDLARKLVDFAERNPEFNIEHSEDAPSDPADAYKGKQAKTLRKLIAERKHLDMPADDADRDDLVAILVADDADEQDHTDETEPEPGDDTDK